MGAVQYESCKNCKHRLQMGRCPIDARDRKECPSFMAEKVNIILQNAEVALQIPLDTIGRILRLHGFSGELKQTIIKTI